MTSIYFSDFFNIKQAKLNEYGAFDISLINDLPLFIDPFLLFNSDKPEYNRLHDQIIKYMVFLKEITLRGNIPGPLVKSLFSFSEVRQNWLGFSQSGNSGHGLGSDFAFTLHRNFETVFKDFGEEKLTKSSHLEKLCLIRNGVGRDTISDFTVNLIKHFIASYTEEFAKNYLPKKLRGKFRLARVRFNYSTNSWAPETYELPVFKNDFVLLTPKDILTKDESWINRSDLIRRFDEITAALPDDTLRAHLNDYLQRALAGTRYPTVKERNEAAVKAIEKYPRVLDYYIRNREFSGDEAVSVSSSMVKFVEAQFIDHVKKFVANYLDPGGFYRIPSNTYEEAKQRLNFLKDVIENKGGHRFFSFNGRPIERETDLHVLFRLTWFANSSDISSEVNDGRGPVDFKVSKGAKDKTLIEFKLAKNSQLERNLKNQTDIYEKASSPTHPTLKAILYFNEQEHRRVLAILNRLQLNNSPNIILIDGSPSNKPSGSKA